MTTETLRTRDKFMDAIDEVYNALISMIEATEGRGHKVSTTLLAEARKGEREASKLARGWVDSPVSVYENLEAMIDAQARAQTRVLELVRESLNGAGTYRGDLRKGLRRVTKANRTIAEAIVEVARAGSRRAARQVERLPRPSRARPRATRLARIPVAAGEGAQRKAG
jgi:hypothetical protein